MKLPIAVDLETTSVDPEKGSILSCNISDGEKTAAWVVKSPEDLQATKEILASPEKKIVHYVPMEGEWSSLFFGDKDPDYHKKFIDTALLAYRVDPGEPMKLASVVARHLPEFSGWKGSTEEQLAAPETGRSMLGVAEKDLLERGAVDACLTRRVYDKLWPKLTKDEQDLHEEDVAISLFVSRMSRRGMYISEDRLVGLRAECLSTMAQEESWLRKETGIEDLNPGSSQQLGGVFSNRGVELPKTKTGKDSVNGLALRVLRHDSTDPKIKEFVDHVLSYRKAQDRLGDNVTAYAQARDPRDGRIRGGFFWPGTVSWRPSCFAPNRLNVPREGVRHLFAAPPGWVFLECDLSQAELRIMAQLSGDPVLVQGFRDGVDFHRRMGSRIYDVPGESITKVQRYVGKKTNFSCGYFIGDNALWESCAKEDLILPFPIVQKARATYWKEYSGLGKYADEQRRNVRNGENLYAPSGGYHWNLEQATLIHPYDENEAVNSVYNWTIQSVPPRLVYRMGMLLERRVPAACLEIVNSVYDCLCMYVREDVVPDVCRQIEEVRKEVLAKEAWLCDVDIPVDIKVGKSWGEKELQEWKQ